jgi:hypothetical protein
MIATLKVTKETSIENDLRITGDDADDIFYKFTKWR